MYHDEIALNFQTNFGPAHCDENFTIRICDFLSINLYFIFQAFDESKPQFKLLKKVPLSIEWGLCVCVCVCVFEN
jgi:hypothetical protein